MLPASLHLSFYHGNKPTITQSRPPAAAACSQSHTIKWHRIVPVGTVTLISPQRPATMLSQVEYTLEQCDG